MLDEVEFSLPEEGILQRFIDVCRNNELAGIYPASSISLNYSESQSVLSLVDKMNKILNISVEYGQVDGSHHKMWVIDQIVRILTGESYEEFIDLYEEPDENGDIQYSWDTGIAP